MILAVSEAFLQTLGLILIFFVALPVLAQGLIAFAAAQSLGERKRNRELRRERDDIDSIRR